MIIPSLARGINGGESRRVEFTCKCGGAYCGERLGWELAGQIADVVLSDFESNGLPWIAIIGL